MYFWFSRRICWFCKNLRENQKNKKNKPISKGGSETFKNFVFLVVPNVLLVFFGFLLYCWFYRVIFCFFLKTFGKTKKQKKPNPYPRVGLKLLQTLFFWFVLMFLFCFLWFSLVFLVFPKVFWFSHISNSVWLVCVGVCMVLCKFSRFACTP